MKLSHIRNQTNTVRESNETNWKRRIYKLVSFLNDNLFTYNVLIFTYVVKIYVTYQL